MDALDQQLLTRRIDRIEHKLDKLTSLIEVLLSPPVIVPETFRAGEPRVEYIGPALQAEDFEGS